MPGGSNGVFSSSHCSKAGFVTAVCILLFKHNCTKWHEFLCVAELHVVWVFKGSIAEHTKSHFVDGDHCHIAQACYSFTL